MTQDNIKSFLVELWNKEYPDQKQFINSILRYNLKYENAKLTDLEFQEPKNRKKANKYAKMLINNFGGVSEVEFPPLVCLNNTVIDGLHRCYAYQKANWTNTYIIRIETN